jgi:NADP-dependent 3-hydroxy acid dehydrogenase YdfG
MDKIAIITGVSREMGLGYETAKKLKELVFEVIITGRDFDKVSSLANQLKMTAKQLDVTDGH